MLQVWMEGRRVRCDGYEESGIMSTIVMEWRGRFLMV